MEVEQIRFRASLELPKVVFSESRISHSSAPLLTLSMGITKGFITTHIKQRFHSNEKVSLPGNGGNERRTKLDSLL